MLSDSSVRSIRDLQQVLRIDSVEADSPSSYLNSTRLHPGPLSRGKRSLDGEEPVETAVLAECKTRIEVFEITRSMVDSTNANFLVWPPCVEVQRCTGCCNTRSMQCRPTQARVRHVQVNKIEIVLRKPVFHKAVVALEDHLECRCEPVSSRLPSQSNLHPRKGGPLPSTVASLPTRAQVRQLPARKRKHRKYKQLHDKKALKEIYPA
ncbi:platelet-derived growth factor subunit B isoform X2 [Anolis carolinensis]